MIKIVRKKSQIFFCGLNKKVVSPLVVKKLTIETKQTECGLYRSIMKNGLMIKVIS